MLAAVFPRPLRTMLVPAAAAAVAVAFPTAASGATALPGGLEQSRPTSCTVEQLKEPVGSTLSIVTGADPTGRYIAGRGYPEDPNDNFERQVVIWDEGAPTLVDVPGSDQQLADVNTAGVAVGFSFDAATFERLSPWIYRNGEVSALPGVESGDARGINERGDVVGNRSLAGSGLSPVWWPADGTTPGTVDLPLPDGAASGEAWDIDEDGTVVGVYTDKEAVDHGYISYPDGTTSPLPLPDGYGPASLAFEIRNGWVVGYGSGPDGPTGLRWDLEAGQVEEFPQFDTRPDTVNAHGWMAGVDLEGHALFVSEAGDLSLPGLVDHNEPLGDIATELSDDGRTIAGQALDPAGDIRAVRWLCVGFGN